MQKGTMGMMIASKRKELGMTQMELAEKMGVTDKAVSKWERDLSCPDISSLPKLAEIFGMSVDELMQVRTDTKENTNNKVSEIVNLALKGVALAMGIAVVVLSFIGDVGTNEAVSMLGIGLACLSVAQFSKKS